jgi:hypothetical protein
MLMMLLNACLSLGIRCPETGGAMLLIVFSEGYDLKLVRAMSSLKDQSHFNDVQSQLLILANPGLLVFFLY